MQRVMIAGTNSGCGKTTITCAILSAFKKRGVNVSAYKCGPDYIDPMFHRKAIGVPSRNLDPFFSTPEQQRSIISKCSTDISIIEGVMGYYDGVGLGGEYSSYSVASATQTPVVLTVNAKGMYNSAGAILSGFTNYKPDSNICGVIFNNVSEGVYAGLKEIALCAGVTPLGFLPYDSNAAVESRNLGLVTADEITDIEKKLDRLAELAKAYIDLDGLINLATSAPVIEARPETATPLGNVRIGVAKDDAFCFIYEDNLQLLSELGCELKFFSPLNDTELSKDINALYLCGGYPELYLNQLSGNSSMLGSVKHAIDSGMPTIAECGGFLYLHDNIDGIPMVGAIHAEAFGTEKLRRFGYVTLTANQDNLLCKSGDSIRSHEFHYYDSSDNGSSFHADKPLSTRAWDCVHASPSLYAGFPHLYFGANPKFAESFVRKAIEYAN